MNRRELNKRGKEKSFSINKITSKTESTQWYNWKKSYKTKIEVTTIRISCKKGVSDYLSTSCITSFLLKITVELVYIWKWCTIIYMHILFCLFYRYNNNIRSINERSNSKHIQRIVSLIINSERYISLNSIHVYISCLTSFLSRTEVTCDINLWLEEHK